MQPRRHSIGNANLNVTICATHAWISVGEDGGSHQTVEDIALMRSVPNMTVIVPSDGISTRQALFQLYQHDGPAYLRLGRPAVPQVHDPELDFAIGRAVELRKGKDLSLMACGIMVSKALQAAEIRAGEGTEVSVVDILRIYPLVK